MSKENMVMHNQQERRFELALDEGKTAFIQYVKAGEGVVELMHTEVPEEFEGQGIGGRLVSGTFELLQEENLKMIPTCRFVSVYLQRHPEYQSLAASASE